MTVLTAVLQTIHDLSFWGMAIVLFAALGGLLALPAESFFIPKPDATPSETGQGRAVA